MRQKILATTAAAVLSFGLAGTSSAATLELGLVIDASGSISAEDWGLQIGAYQSVFEDNFYSTFVADSPFDDIAVGAYVFSGFITDFADAPPEFSDFFAVLEFIPWTLITDDQSAAEFGAQFADLSQSGGGTATAKALRTATNGGDVGCPVGLTLNQFECGGISTAPGILNNGFEGDRLVIDISTDGVPTLPAGDSPPGGAQPNDEDRADALAAANEARGESIVVNAIGVGGIDSAFLTSLVGIDPAETPEGFFLEADDFDAFEETLRIKLDAEINVIPIPGALPLFFSALAGLGLWRRRTHH